MFSVTSPPSEKASYVRHSRYSAMDLPKCDPDEVVAKETPNEANTATENTRQAVRKRLLTMVVVWLCQTERKTRSINTKSVRPKTHEHIFCLSYIHIITVLHALYHRIMN